MAWASGSVGTIAAMASPRFICWRRIIHSPTRMPAVMPPGMPKPPFQMARASSQPSDWNRLQSVITW